MPTSADLQPAFLLRESINWQAHDRVELTTSRINSRQITFFPAALMGEYIVASVLYSQFVSVVHGQKNLLKSSTVTRSRKR